MTFLELQAEINQLFDLASDPNFSAEDLAIHAIRWYSSFMFKETSDTFTVTSGTKSYTFSSSYDNTVPRLIIDDDDMVLRPYSIYQPDSTGSFYVLPNGNSYKLVFRDTPDRTRDTTFLYTRPITVPDSSSDVIDVPDKHIYILLYFVEALSEAQRQVEFIWGGLPTNYEAYFLGQTGDQVRRSWERCLAEREKIQAETAYNDLNVSFVVDWQQMDVVDNLIRPIPYQYIH